MRDEIAVADAQIVHSPPDVASWAKTVRITSIEETPDGGFLLAFDREIPDSWKWPSNPDVPSDNFAFTVWFFLSTGLGWIAAGFVQMWKDRPMGRPDAHAIPPIFHVAPGDIDPGWKNLWGDPRRWPEMAGHEPSDGEVVGIMVSAGNGRLTDARDREHGLSVRERSNAVLFTLRASDRAEVIYPESDAGNGGGPVVDPPPVVTPPIPPADPTAATLLGLRDDVFELGQDVDARAAAVIAAVAQARVDILARLNGIVASPGPGSSGPAPIYDGEVTIPFIGKMKITLIPRAK